MNAAAIKEHLKMLMELEKEVYTQNQVIASLEYQLSCLPDAHRYTRPVYTEANSNYQISGLTWLCFGSALIFLLLAPVSDAIINSDNTSYYRMRNAFERSASESLSAWLSSMNISTTLANDTSFPHYSARESLKLWMNTFLYLNSPDSNKEITEWAKKMFSGTAVSMVRSGVDPTSNPVSREKRCPGAPWHAVYWQENGRGWRS